MKHTVPRLSMTQSGLRMCLGATSCRATPFGALALGGIDADPLARNQSAFSRDFQNFRRAEDLKWMTEVICRWVCGPTAVDRHAGTIPAAATR